MLRKMNNLLTYDEYVNESRSYSINVEIKKDEMTISGTEKTERGKQKTLEFSDEDKDEIKDIISSGKKQREFLQRISGGVTKNNKNFKDIIDDNLKLIMSLNGNGTRKFPDRSMEKIGTHGCGYVSFEKYKKKDILNRVFQLTTNSFGKGELLLAAYYGNVKRTNISKIGDCQYEDGEKISHIEVKSMGSEFKNVDVENKEKENPMVKGIEEYLLSQIEKIKKGDDKFSGRLDLVIFDNDKNGNVMGYLYIPIEPTDYENNNESKDELYEKLKELSIEINARKKETYFVNSKPKSGYFSIKVYTNDNEHSILFSRKIKKRRKK